MGNALVQRLGQAVPPTEGLRAMEAQARSLIAVLPYLRQSILDSLDLALAGKCSNYFAQ